MKKVLAIIAIALLFAACSKSVCPAYMDGGSTGTSGTGGKKQDLFPPAMKK